MVLNLFFPPRCGFCAALFDWAAVPEANLCEQCISRITFIGLESCRFCGKQLNNHKQTECGQCAGLKYYTRAISACEYEGLVREKLLEFKYKGNRQLAGIFSYFIAKKLKMTKQQNFDIIISVPIHSSKREERGFNQSELIAGSIAEYLGKPLSTCNLIRTKQTESQSKLDKKYRFQNIRDAFEVVNAGEIRGKRILLIDDILTTGATANECSKILKESGAEEVYVATVATGRSNPDIYVGGKVHGT